MTADKKVKRPNSLRITQLFDYLFTPSKDKNIPFFPSDYFFGTKVLEQNWETIHAELSGLLESIKKIPNVQDIAISEKVLTEGEQWKAYCFVVFNQKIEENCIRCPKTSEIIFSLPNVTSAWFSILAPGKKLMPHRGYYKGILRCHLGLKIPSGNRAGICVDGETRHWEQGKCLIFDDNFVHHVWNNSEEHRVVLWLDFLRPTSFWLKWVNRLGIYYFAHSELVKDLLRRQSLWNKSVWESKLFFETITNEIF